MKRFAILLSVAVFGALSFIYLNQSKTVWEQFENVSEAEMNDRPKYDRIDLAVLQDYYATRDPETHEIPNFARVEAFNQARKILQNRPRANGAIAGVDWIERGPNNVGGRTRAVMFDPNDATNRRVFAAGVAGGIWVNDDITNANSSWTAINDFLSNLAVVSLAADPSDPQVMYAGTGEGFFNFDAVRGVGIFKSTDGGATWNLLSSSTSFQNTHKIIVAPNGDVYAATTNGLHRSTNGGTSFTQLRSGSYADLERMSNGDLYAAEGIFYHGGLFKSTNNGSSWTDITPNNNTFRIEIGVSESSNNVVYAMAQGNGFNGVSWIMRSDDGGSTWNNLPIPTLAENAGADFTRSNQAWYDLIFGVHPTDASKVMIGGIDVFYSSNSGANWDQKTHWFAGFGLPFSHADQHTMIARPGSDNTFVFGNDGGVFICDDITANNWNIQARNKDYNVTQFYSVAMENSANTNYYLGGTQDNGTHQFTNAGINSTNEVTGGDGGFCFIDQDNPNIQISCFTNNSYNLSTNGGASFNNFVDETVGRFINPADYDDDANILYAAGNDDQVKRYANIGTGAISNNTLSIPLGGNQPSHIKVSPSQANTIYVGADNGVVAKVTNANGSPNTQILVNEGDFCFGCQISCIEEGSNSNNLIATVSNYNTDHVYISTDGGNTWTSKDGNLPNIPVRWALFDPNSDNRVMLATEVGVWSTDNISAGSVDWAPTNSNLANVRCDMLQIRESDNQVIVATHGRGMFTTNVFGGSVADFTFDKAFTYTGETIQFTDASSGANGIYSWNFGDGQTSTQQNPTHQYANAGTYSVTLTIDNGQATTTKTDIITILPVLNTSFTAAQGGDFETNQNFFVAQDVQGSSFELGNSNISGKNGTSSGSNAWVLDINNSTYQSSTEALLFTPAFDLTTVADYTLQFESKFDIETGWDGFIVQFSTDAGLSWQKLGNGVQSNWYNTSAQNAVFSAGEGIFSNTVNSYTNFSFDISNLSGNDMVAFRFVFRSDASVVEAGVAIDDFEIIQASGLTADFSADETDICQGETVVFTNQSFGGAVTDYAWNFGNGANPATATGPGPHSVTYNATGNANVTLNLNNGESVETKSNYINTQAPPVVSNIVRVSPEPCVGGFIALEIVHNAGANAINQLFDAATDQPIGTNNAGTNGNNRFEIENIQEPISVYAVVETSRGCISSPSSPFQIVPFELEPKFIQGISNGGYCEGETVTVFITEIQDEVDYELRDINGTVIETQQSVSNDTSYHTFVATNGLNSIEMLHVFSASCLIITEEAIQINPNPIVTINGETEVCKGASIDVSVTGADQYIWSGGLGGNDQYTLFLTETTTYNVTGTTNNCTGTASITIEVLGIDSVFIDDLASSIETEPASNGLYQLQNCSNGIIEFFGSNGNFDSVSSADDYRAIFEVDGCIYESDCKALSPSTNIDRIWINERISIYPIPSSYDLNIVNQSNLKGDFTIYDVNGKVMVQSIELKETQAIDVSNWAQGAYLIQYNIDQRVGYQNFVVE